MRNESSRVAFLGAFVAALALPVVAARAFPGGAVAGGRGGGAPQDSGAPQADGTLVEINVMPAADLRSFRPMSAGSPDQAGIARISENWESDAVFERGSSWRTFDPFVSQPSLNDEIRWGRRNCQATVGSWALWSVGGGSFGAAYPCGSNYPSPLPNRPNGGIRSELQYLYLNFAPVPAVGGLRVTFDYKARMPAQALFVGAGDFDNRNPDGSIPIRGRNDFTSDTLGDWVRGHHVEIKDDADFKITGKARVLFAMVYADPPPQGSSPPGSGNFGVFVDNVHLDALFLDRVGYVPSPGTPTPTASDTPTGGPTPTKTTVPIIFPTTATPRNLQIALPVAMQRFQQDMRTPVPTAPTATNTVTRPPPTNTVTPTDTPTDQPTVTPIPTFTPIPFAEVLFEYIAHLTEPEEARVKNYGTLAQDMTNWHVFEHKNTENCYFPAGLILGPGEHFSFLTGRNSSPGPGVAVCNPSRLIWDNNEDEGQLWNELNDRVDRLCFDRYGPRPCDN